MQRRNFLEAVGGAIAGSALFGSAILEKIQQHAVQRIKNSCGAVNMFNVAHAQRAATQFCVGLSRWRCLLGV